jgi:hypothetical protein
MSTVIIFAIVCSIALIIAATTWLRRHEPADLGSVSNNWIAEQKFGPQGDSRR